MKKIFKNFSITLFLIMLLSVSYSAKAIDYSFTETETESSLVLEDWMTNEFIWQTDQKDKKGTPMLAITPEGDTVKVFIEEVVKAKDTVINQYNTYNTYNTYRNYDGWMFYYNDAWVMSSIWYHNYYHVYYPIVHRHIYHSPQDIKRYYKKHNVVVINPEVIRHGNMRVYDRPTKFNPNRSRYNNYYDRDNNHRSYYSPNSKTYYSQPNYNNQRRTTGQQPQIQRPNRPQPQPMNRGSNNSRQGRR